jgi:hypothetical protein
MLLCTKFEQLLSTVSGKAKIKSLEDEYMAGTLHVSSTLLGLMFNNGENNSTTGGTTVRRRMSHCMRCYLVCFHLLPGGLHVSDVYTLPFKLRGNLLPFITGIADNVVPLGDYSVFNHLVVVHRFPPSVAAFVSDLFTPKHKSLLEHEAGIMECLTSSNFVFTTRLGKDVTEKIMEYL